eukprot:8989900-Pyramimonas_sp.AAC.1
MTQTPGATPPAPWATSRACPSSSLFRWGYVASSRSWSHHYISLVTFHGRIPGHIAASGGV